MIVLDASATLAALFDDERGWRAGDLLRLASDETFVVPGHWSCEVAGTLVVAERTRRIDPHQFVALLEVMDSLPIEVDAETADLVLKTLVPMARSHRTSVFDAAYVELAERLRLPLATLDRGMTRVARERGVELLLS